MNAHFKARVNRGNWDATTTPMNTPLDQKIIDYMVAYVNEAIGIVTPGTLTFGVSRNPVHLLEKEKEFKYGKGKEYIAFTDGGKNQFDQEVKYVKFFSYYESTGKLKSNDKTYTYSVEKARVFWAEKIGDGYSRVTPTENILSFPPHVPPQVTPHGEAVIHVGENPGPKDVSPGKTIT